MFLKFVKIYFYAGLEMCEWKTQLHVKLTTYGMIQ